MHTSLVKVSSNWSHIGGCSFLEAVQERAADAEFFIRPKLNELVDEEKSILLNKQQSSEYCELYIKLCVSHKIQAVSFVCNVVKVEIFQGPIKEYLRTFYGVIIDENDDLFKTYRYDVEIEKSGITDLTLRFLSGSSDICIFGVILQSAPNPIGVTTLLPNAGCVSVDVENILQNSTKQPNLTADKFKKLLDLGAKSNQYNSLASDQNVKQNVNIHSEQCTTNEDIIGGLKSYIDGRLQEMEKRLNRNLEDMEERQNRKLDTILNILEKMNK